MRFDYFAGNDLTYPTLPIKPRLEKNPTPAAVRSYADDLEQYEKDYENYLSDLHYYKDQKDRRLKEFKDQLRDDYDISQAQFNVLWEVACRYGHDSGLNEVYQYFDDFFDMAYEFAAMGKS